MFAHFRSALIRTDFENEYFQYVYGWNSIFTCFYMPAFFFISGLCSNFRKDTKSFLISIFKSLVIPLFALSVIDDAINALVLHQDLPIVLLSTITKGGTLWFLQALILSKIICYLMCKMTVSRIVMLSITLFLLTFAVALNQFNIGNNPFHYQHGLVASFFVALGLFAKENTVIYEKLLSISLWLYPMVGIITFWYSPSFTAYLSVSLKLIPLFLVLSIYGTLFLLAICKKFNTCRFFEHWGKNSLVVYGLHFVPYVFFFKTLYVWMRPTCGVSFFFFLAFLFAAEYTFCYMLMSLFQYKPFKWMLGKFWKHRSYAIAYKGDYNKSVWFLDFE